MTTAQIARVFHARRVSKGKWMAKCPAHREKTASLYITERKDGSTGIHCFGCMGSPSQLLSPVGLSVTDLFAGSRPNKEALREAERQRALEERERRRKKDAIWKTVEIRDHWRKRVEMLARGLMVTPKDDRLSSRFFSALNKARMLDQSVVDQMCKLYKFKADDFVWGE
jgi:hypothetical protein